MKILCVCRSGLVRSVATKRCLNQRRYKDVIAVGFEFVSYKTFTMLCKWADLILIAKPSHGVFIPYKFQSKVNKVFTIGDDIWGTPVNWQLEETINKQLNLIGL